MAEKINKKIMDAEIDNEEDEFSMEEDEKQEAKSMGGFNPFWNTKNMEVGKAYKFKIISDKIGLKMIEDNFANGEKTPRMIISVELLDTGALYDIAANKNPNKEGKYSSLTLAMRRLYAITDGNVGGKMISMVKSRYKHEKWGDVDGFKINLLNEFD